MPSFLQSVQATQPSVSPTTFTATDTTVAKAVVTAPGGPWHLFEILFTSDDTAAQVADVFVHVGATNFLIGSISIPAGTGKNGVAPVGFIKNEIPDSQTGLDFAGATSVQVAMEATVTAAKTVTVTAFLAVY